MNLRKTTQHLTLLAFTLCVSCGDKEPDIDYSVFGYLYFKEKSTIVEVDKDTKSFKLEAISGDMTMSYISYVVYLNAEETTAEDGVHFVKKETVFEYGEGADIFMNVELIPENITSEVQIVYRIARITGSGVPNPNQKDIYTTTIRLVPKSKK